MARPLSTLTSMEKPSLLSIPTTLIGLAAVLSLLSIVTFLCGSHLIKRRKSHRRIEGEISLSSSSSSRPSDHKKILSKLNSNISEKAHLVVKMISRKVGQDREGDDDADLNNEEEVVWKKPIIMGERCRPLDFSGKIEYDSEGKLVSCST